MENLLVALVVLACPVGMGLMMWFMAKGMRRGNRPVENEEAISLEDLRAEHRRLGAEIEGLETGSNGDRGSVAGASR